MTMNKRNAEVDIVNDVLEHCILAYPVSSFVISVYKQYMHRGSLSKKQLQGVYAKAALIEDMPVAKLATLEAVIKRMPTRYKSELPAPKPLFEKDESLAGILEDILKKYPKHKRVLFLKLKYVNNELLSPTEVAEIRKFNQILK